MFFPQRPNPSNSPDVYGWAIAAAVNPQAFRAVLAAIEHNARNGVHWAVGWISALLGSRRPGPAPAHPVFAKPAAASPAPPGPVLSACLATLPARLVEVLHEMLPWFAMRLPMPDSPSASRPTHTAASRPNDRSAPTANSRHAPLSKARLPKPQRPKPPHDQAV